MDRRALTEREQAIATLAALGQTNAEIAAELGVSLATVKRHLANVMIKWNVRNRTRLALEAWADHEGAARRAQPSASPSAPEE